MPNIRDLIRCKFATDSLWLLGSQVLLSICGLSINILLTNKFSSDGFGIFSIAFKIYLITSLLASLATNVVVLRYITQHKKHELEGEECLSSALSLTLVSSLIVTLACFLLSPLLASVYKEESLGNCLMALSAGLPFFALNKFYFAILNGLRLMRTFAFMQAFRWILLFAFVLLTYFFTEQALWFYCVLFPLTECIVFIIVWLVTSPHFSSKLRWQKKWIKEHVQFGINVVSSGTLLETFTHTDIFLLGLFTNAGTTGLYAFAVDIAKNLFAFTDIIQTNFNPIIAELWWKKNKQELTQKMHAISRFTYALYIPVCLLAIAAYYILIHYFLLDKNYAESFMPFIILCVGVFLFSGIRPSIAIFELSGHPNLKLKATIVAQLFLLISATTLIYFYSLNGVALAMLSSYLVYAIILYYLARQKLFLNLL